MDENLTTAFMAAGFPCNPLPFINALNEGIRIKGVDWIVSNDAHALLHTLNSMAHGQLYSLDSVAEYSRLSAIFKKTY